MKIKNIKIAEELVFKTYDDNKLMHFEVTLCEHQNKPMVLINGLPEHGEIMDKDTLARIIKCLEGAYKRWDDYEN